MRGDNIFIIVLTYFLESLARNDIEQLFQVLIWIYYYLSNRIGLSLDLDNSFWIRKIIYFLLFNNINIWFSTPLNIWSRDIELDCIWTILLEIINYSIEWRNTADVLLVYVTMTCNAQSCIKSTVIWMEISSCANYQKMEL